MYLCDTSVYFYFVLEPFTWVMYNVPIIMYK